MRWGNNYFTFFLVFIGFASCNKPTDHEKIMAWYENTKTNIENQADLEHDKVLETTDPFSGEQETKYYHEKHLFKKEIRDINNVVIYRVLYAKDTNFCFVQQICTNGQISYEGIEYKRKPYGLSTWYHCENGKIEEQGIRLKFKKWGIWKKYHADGTVKMETMHEAKIKLRSFPKLKD